MRLFIVLGAEQNDNGPWREFLEAALSFERKMNYRNMSDALEDVNIFSDKIVKPNFL